MAHAIPVDRLCVVAALGLGQPPSTVSWNTCSAVRLDPELRQAVEARSTADHTTTS